MDKVNVLLANLVKPKRIKLQPWSTTHVVKLVLKLNWKRDVRL